MRSLIKKNINASAYIVIGYAAVMFAMLKLYGSHVIDDALEYDDVIKNAIQPILVIGVIIMAAFVFSVYAEEKNKRVEEFLMSTPLKKSQIFISKYAVFSACALVLSVAYYIETCGLRTSTYIKLNEKIDILKIWFNGYSARCSLVLFAVLFAANMVLSLMFEVATDSKFVAIIYVVCLIGGLNIIETMTYTLSEVTGIKSYNDIFSTKYALKVALFFMIIGITSLAIAYILNKRYESSMCGKLIWFRPAKYMFDVIAGLIAGRMTLTMNKVDSMSSFLRISLFVITTLIVAIVVNKLLDRYDKE